MKLNNGGWGFREMIYLSCGLLIALGISIFYISRLYGSLEKSFDKNDYFELETKLENAAIAYKNDRELDINGYFKINASTLKNEGYIDQLKDKNGNICAGYVVISEFGDNIDYKGYISCNNYVTDGY